ncbi:hypothetical protein [Streptomyces sp. NPDC056387]|uniref:hypothetical protein n=1 Tax=Streptomyces sp. NPDC056387 TaxID=3345803 RepID=UPI0035DC63E9
MSRSHSTYRAATPVMVTVGFQPRALAIRLVAAFPPSGSLAGSGVSSNAVCG